MTEIKNRSNRRQSERKHLLENEITKDGRRRGSGREIREGKSKREKKGETENERGDIEEEVRKRVRREKRRMSGIRKLRVI